MTQHEFLAEFELLCNAELDLTKRKNADYANATDAFVSFRLIEHLTNYRISMEDGILVRISDKLQRAANLLSRPAQVVEEQIEDTLKDLSVYSKIWMIVRKSRLERQGDVKTAPIQSDLIPTSPINAALANRAKIQYDQCPYTNIEYNAICKLSKGHIGAHQYV